MKQVINITVKYTANDELYKYFNSVSFPDEKASSVFLRIIMRRKQLLNAIPSKQQEIIPKLLKIIKNTNTDLLYQTLYPTKDDLLKIITTSQTKDKVKSFYIDYITSLTIPEYYKLIDILELLWKDTYAY